MIKLGLCAKRIIATLANNYNPNQPFRFTKLDTKDGFWCLQVNTQYEWNFGYALLYFAPTKEIDNINIVVPKCLHMGWCKSTPFFCADSETAWDVISSLLQSVSLQENPFENFIMETAQDSTSHRLKDTS